MEPKKSHVLVFPFLLQGHVNPMLQLAELLCISGVNNVTFLCTQYHHQRLLRFTDAETRFASFPGFRFHAIPDGLPEEHPRSFSQIEEIFHGIRSVVEPSFRELLSSNYFQPPLTCIIADGMMSFAIAVGNDLKIPTIDFRGTNAAYLWSIYRFPNMVESGELPFTDSDMDKLISSIPGMESYLRCRDLPSFCRGPIVNDVFKLASSPYKPSAYIINTFEDLEAPILSQMKPHFPKIYTLGPLHALLTSLRSNSSPLSNNSLREVDRSCITWLESQSLRSVVYVSFGTTVMMTNAQILELWYGLVNSGKKFLWVMRPAVIVDRDENWQIPTELEEGTKDRGYIVGWCPQEEVLAHPAIGGFVTHSGWSSIMESIYAGVPMLCWPSMGDQHINSRFVGEVWKIGLDMKDMFDREIIEKMVNDLMLNEVDKLRTSMDLVSDMASKSVKDGGSSHRNLVALIECIQDQ